MKLIMVVPRVVQNFISQFPESSRNAYKYFNFDRRVVEERVQRGSGQNTNEKLPYQGPYDLTNADYSALVVDAKARINPILAKYSARVAHEDALNLAIRDFNNGQFDGKVNADHFKVLVNAMEQPSPVMPSVPVMAKGKEKPVKKEKPAVVPHHILKQLKIDPRKVVQKSLIRKIDKDVPYFVREKGVIVKKDAE